MVELFSRVVIETLNVRRLMIERYGRGKNLSGRSEEANQILVDELCSQGFSAESVNGWVLLNKGVRVPHSWVVVSAGNNENWVIDVTIDQFGSLTAGKQGVVSGVLMSFGPPSFFTVDGIKACNAV